VTSPLRRAVERHSGLPLAWLATRPRWVPFALVLALLVGGLFAPPAIGIALLVLLGVLLGWLTYLSWPQLPAGGRLARLLVLALVVVAIVQRSTEG
jgi:hypothetical protein